MIEFLRARSLEGMHLAALWIDPGHHVGDDSILPRGIETLQHHQHRPAILGVEALLQIGEALEAPGEELLAFVFVETAGFISLEVREPELVGLVDAVAIEKLAHAFGPICNLVLFV